MITEQDLQEAIAECEGVRNPNSSTCMKLAAFYIIRDELFPKEKEKTQVSQIPAHSYATTPPQSVEYSNDTEFSEIISDKKSVDVLAVMDELMSTLQIVNPRLYEGVIRKLNSL